jgi:pimeloyl-ACP methyl ester carboxylesterase
MIVDEGTFVGGPADGHPVAFVHGAGLTWRMWLPKLRALDDGYRLFAPDRPGHGSRADESFCFDAGVRVLDDRFRDEIEEPALVGGQSLGGYVAIEYADRRPARVAGLVNRIRAANEPLEPRFREGVEAHLEDGPLQPDIVAAVVDGGISLAGYGQEAMAVAGLDISTKLQEFDGRSLLLLYGPSSRLDPRAAETFEPSLPGAETQAHSSAGHTCSIERPDEDSSIVREFATVNVWRPGTDREERP